MMPGLYGFEFARQIGESLPGCRILLFSALAELMNAASEDSEKGRSVTILQKPLAIAEIC
jgi:hypothetical protein